LLDLLLADPDDARGGDIHQTAYAQPALFAFEHAMTELWRSLGVEPDAVLGHSIGELGATWAAGVYNLADAMRLVCERGRLMPRLPGDGAMAMVRGAPDEVSRALPDGVEIAAINGPEHLVITGPRDAVAAALARLEDEYLYVKELKTSHAFHSAMMEPMLDSFEAVARSIAFAPPRIPLVSCLSGKLLGHDEMPDARHWRRHARMPTLFQAGVDALLASGVDIVLEVGPHHVLAELGKQCARRSGVSALWLCSARRDRDAWETLAGTAAALFTAGAAMDWSGLDAEVPRRRGPLPTYPFQRERVWLDDASLRSLVGPLAASPEASP
jgi:acyl transferase domain-containing protein